MFEEEFALRRQDRGFGEVIVAGKRQNPAVAVRAAGVGLTQASPARSTPGALPYQMPKTPS
jgi:hypothetical protein